MIRPVIRLATPALLVLSLAATPASATSRNRIARLARKPETTAIPQLGDDVPQTLLKRASSAKPCDIGDGHTDPCATLSAGNNRFLVAWDAATHRVTYLYTTTLDTDNDIRAGDVLGIDPDSPITPFPAAGQPHRFLTSDWCDTDTDLTGDAEWCAVMVPARPRSGRVLGFVQSLYLYMPDFDPEPIERTAFHLWSRRATRAISGARPPHLPGPRS